MKKLLLYSLFILFTLVLSQEQAQAQTFDFTSYYPAPLGNYTSIRLKPQSAITPDTNCPIGTLYANADDESLIYYCSPTMGLSKFLPLPGVWSLNGNDLYLTDTTTPLNKKVGIGTITPIFKLTLENDGGIFAKTSSSDIMTTLTSAGAGTRLIWYPAANAFRAGYVPLDEWDPANIGLFSIALGYGNKADGDSAVILGGEGNRAMDLGSIGGGKNNTVTAGLLGSANSGFVLGGENNSVESSQTIVSGDTNLSGLDGDFSAILGGTNNTSYGTNSVIWGGSQNSFPNNLALNSVIAGGAQNLIRGCTYCAVGGGKSNTIEEGGLTDVIAGGALNLSRSTSTVSGGTSNIAFVVSTVSGGSGNTANAAYAVVGGGQSNQALGSTTAVSGGALNVVNATSVSSTILGGQSNAINGASYATIVGGSANITAGDYSLAAGRNMRLSAAADRTFLWGYSASAITTITAPDAFIIYSGKVGIRDTNPAALLEINGNGSTDDYLDLTTTAAAAPGNRLIIKNNGYIGVGITPTHPLHFSNGVWVAYVSAAGNFMSASSRKYKENISELDLKKALETLSGLTPVRYNYKNEKDEEYIGFIAEDVPELVVDKNREGIAPMDITAVLTKVVQDQQRLIDEQRKNSEILMKEVDQLESKIKNRKDLKYHE